MPKLLHVLLVLVALLSLPSMAATDMASVSFGEAGPAACDALLQMSRMTTQDASPARPTADPLEPLLLTGCTAEKTCFGGNVVSCTGSTSCSVDCGSVTCDGTQVECTCSAGCGSTAYCACRSCGGPHHLCFQNFCV